MSPAVAAALPAPPAAARRLDSVDLLRGLVMVVMALDHTRDYFHFSALHGFDPTDLATTTPAIFLTRWITHFCAPLFSFLAGTGVFLAGRQGRSRAELSRLLLLRGAWLILIELTVVNFAWFFTLDLHNVAFLVLWALGWSMIVLAGLIHLPLPAITVFALVLILGHNALDGVAPASWGSWSWLWHLLHVPGVLKPSPAITILAFYPLIPWIGVMALGYAFGRVFEFPPPRRKRLLLAGGTALIAAFVLLRMVNAYGDPAPWQPQPRPGLSFLSFLDCSKYPPSLSYLLMTLGPGLLFLGLVDGMTPRALQPIIVFGRVPFFYYLLHIPLIHSLACLMNLWRYGGGDYFAFSNVKPPADAGLSLPGVYAVWLLVVVVLSVPCRWFAALKRRRRDPWLAFL